MNERVLLVDDERGISWMYCPNRMRDRGMEVTTTTSPFEAMEKAGAENFDAIILDLMMPEMNGLGGLGPITGKTIRTCRSSCSPAMPPLRKGLKP